MKTVNWKKNAKKLNEQKESEVINDEMEDRKEHCCVKDNDADDDSKYTDNKKKIMIMNDCTALSYIFWIIEGNWILDIACF